jgi:cyanate permease
MALIVSPIATICTKKFGTQISLFIGILFQTAGLLGKALLYPNLLLLVMGAPSPELVWSGHDSFALVSW